MLAIISVTALGIFIVLGLGKMVRAIVKEIKKPPPFSQKDCPNRGINPTWSMFSSVSYHARRTGSDNDMVVARCSQCGYSPSTYVGGSALTDVTSGYPDLQHP